MNVYPQAYSFILCSVEPAGFHLAWTHEPGKHSETFGAFKSLRNSFLPLLRAIWRMVRQPKNLAEYPTSLLRGDTCRSFHFNVSASTAFDWILAQVREFLSGKSDRLLTSVQPSDTAETGFEKELQKTDLECLRLFFDKSTRRTALINELAGHGSFGTVIQKEELDDLLALFKSQSQLNIQTSSRQNPVAVVSPICLP